MTKTENLTVAQMVRNDYRTADVFKKWGINYCCGGNLALEEVCALQKLDLSAIEADLKQAIQNVRLSNTLAYDKWSVEFLADYISHVHHLYIQERLPLLQSAVGSFIQGHKKRHPQLEQVQEVFELLAQELLEHTRKEEQSIFPYLKQVSSTYKQKEKYGRLFVRTLSKPLYEIVDTEHRRIAALLQQLREVSDQYAFPSNACTNHQVIYHKLKELDEELVQHKHLENNILYPRVLSMERELLQLL